MRASLVNTTMSPGLRGGAAPVGPPLTSDPAKEVRQLRRPAYL